MARIRTIKPEFFDDEHLCQLPLQHRICFVGLWTQADKAGRLEDRPLRLKARLFPYDDVDMDGILSTLAREGFIVRYQVDGKAFLAIKETSWKKHQRPRPDEPESVLPEPLAETVTSPLRRSDDSVSAERLGKEGKGREEGREIDSSEPPAGDSEPSDPPAAIFSIVGKGGPEWALGQRQVESWRGLYPTIDLDAEIRKAVAWIAANPGRRKTAKGMPAFLVGWLNRATDSRGGSGRAAREYSEFEVRRYEDWLRKLGRCGHNPPCEDRPECMAKFIKRLRGEAA